MQKKRGYKTHLVSFLDGAFKSRKNQFAKSAAGCRFFDSVRIDDFSSLPSDFVKCHGDFIRSNPRGFGYWIWKPVIILQELQRLSKDDCLVYIDGGSTLNPGGGPRFEEYLELTRDSEHKMLSFMLLFTESAWTKADLAERLGLSASSSHLKTSQLSASSIFLQKTDSNIALLEEWIKIAIENNYQYSDDTPSIASNHPSFKEHRHDQSIASLLRKMRGTEVTFQEADPCQQDFFKKGHQSFPVWLTRAKDSNRQYPSY